MRHTQPGSVHPSDSPRPMDEARMTGFHWRVTAFCSGGFLLDGYILGMIGSALAIWGPQVDLGAVSTGLIAASTLVGIFIGGVAVGRLVDAWGRQRIFLVDLMVFLVASLLQPAVEEPWQLIVIRLIMGVAIGADFSIGMTLLAEFAPRRWRGPLLGSLNAIAIVGIALAFVVAEALKGLGDDSWRWMLASSAIPTIVVLLLRLGAPESPRWLVSKGRGAEAQQVLDRFLGEGFVVGEPDRPTYRASYRALFSPELWRRTAFCGGFWACQVLPFYAVYMFLPQITGALGVKEGFGTELFFNAFLIVGAVIGLPLLNTLPRRSFLAGSFAIAAGALIGLAMLPPDNATLIVVAFVVFALSLAAATNLEHSYPGELFPTELRATGVGVAAATSRIGASIGAFLLPISVENVGVRISVLGLAAVLFLGLLITVAWAPETRHLTLAQASAPDMGVASSDPAAASQT